MAHSVKNENSSQNQYLLDLPEVIKNNELFSHFIRAGEAFKSVIERFKHEAGIFSQFLSYQKKNARKYDKQETQKCIEKQ